jgi:hypothetical protein
MRKISKGKLKMDDLLTPYECFMSFDGNIRPDTGYHFVISIQVLTSMGDTKDVSKYNH